MLITLLVKGSQETSGHFQAGRVVGGIIGTAVILLVVLIIVKKARGK
jgi:hypothetical protein